jgi:dCMP deaminase
MKENYKILYKKIAKTLAEFSQASKENVGALLLKDGRIISTGYNGQPSGQPHEAIIQESHDISTIHAEMNCIAFAAKNGIKVRDCDIVSTHFPCVHCTKMLFMTGIKKIYYLEDYRNDDNPYKNLLETEKI